MKFPAQSRDDCVAVKRCALVPRKPLSARLDLSDVRLPGSKCDGKSAPCRLHQQSAESALRKRCKEVDSSASGISVGLPKRNTHRMSS